MNGKQAKNIRKTVNAKVKHNLEDLSEVLCNLNLYWRIIYAIRIILKWNPKPKFVTTKGGNAK